MRQKGSASPKRWLPNIGRPRSLRWRLMSYLGAVWLFMLLFIGIGVVTFVHRAEVESWRGRQGEAARNAAGTVAAFIQRADYALILLGWLGRDELVSQPQVMSEMLRYNPALQEVVYLDADGIVVASAFQDRALLANLFTIPQSRWFVTARAGQPYHGSVQFSSGDEPYLVIALPAPDGGVVAARLHMRVLWEVVADIHFGKTGRAYVVTRGGQIIAHTKPEVVLAQANVSTLPELFATLQEPTQEWYGEYSDLQGASVVGVTAAVPGADWVMVTELPQHEAFAASRTAFILLGGGMFLFLALMMWVSARYLERTIFYPMEALRDGSGRIGSGDLSYRIGISGQDEMGQVAAAFDEMAESLYQRNAELATKTATLVEEVGERKQAEEALRELNEELEERVKQRTAELAGANEILQTEIIERVRAEEQIKASLHEKEVLLQEIHHRVKNNLQVISSLLKLQSRHIEDAQTLEIFKESQHRIRSMALIHEKLYRSANLAQIDFAEYVRDLAAFLFRSYAAYARGTTLTIQADEVLLNIDSALPCGLILNELISNALKHAFPPDSDRPAGGIGEIRIELHKDDHEMLTLIVADNGVGWPKDLDFRETTSLGLQLVNELVNQLDGSIELDSSQGTAFKIAFAAS